MCPRTRGDIARREVCRSYIGSPGHSVPALEGDRDARRIDPRSCIRIGGRTREVPDRQECSREERIREDHWWSDICIESNP